MKIGSFEFPDFRIGEKPELLLQTKCKEVR
jgi:hypothetical protein